MKKNGQEQMVTINQPAADQLIRHLVDRKFGFFSVIFCKVVPHFYFTAGVFLLIITITNFFYCILLAFLLQFVFFLTCFHHRERHNQRFDRQSSKLKHYLKTKTTFVFIRQT